MWQVHSFYLTKRIVREDPEVLEYVRVGTSLCLHNIDSQAIETISMLT